MVRCQARYGDDGGNLIAILMLLRCVGRGAGQASALSEEHERELKKIFDDYDQVGGLSKIKVLLLCLSVLKLTRGA